MTQKRGQRRELNFYEDTVPEDIKKDIDKTIGNCGTCGNRISACECVREHHWKSLFRLLENELPIMPYETNFISAEEQANRLQLENEQLKQEIKTLEYKNNYLTECALEDQKRLERKIKDLEKKIEFLEEDY